MGWMKKSDPALAADKTYEEMQDDINKELNDFLGGLGTDSE